MKYDEPGYRHTARRLARQYFASLRKTRDDLVVQVRHMPKPSPQRAALLKRIRTLHASLGLADRWNSEQEQTQ